MKGTCSICKNKNIDVESKYVLRYRSHVMICPACYLEISKSSSNIYFDPKVMIAKLVTVKKIEIISCMLVSLVAFFGGLMYISQSMGIGLALIISPIIIVVYNIAIYKYLELGKTWQASM